MNVARGLALQISVMKTLKDVIMKGNSESFVPESDKWADEAGMTNRAEMKQGHGNTVGLSHAWLCRKESPALHADGDGFGQAQGQQRQNVRQQRQSWQQPSLRMDKRGQR